MDIITRKNGRKIIPTSNTMQAIFPYGKVGFACQIYHDNINNFYDNYVNWHWQNDLEFSIVKHGQIEVHFLSKKFIVHENEGYLIFPNHLHKITSLEKHFCIYDTIIIDPSILYGKQSSIIYSKYYNPIASNANGILLFSKNNNWGKSIFKLLESMALLLEQKPSCYELSITQHISDLWKILVQNTPCTIHYPTDTTIKKITENKLQNMLSYIHKNYNQPISLDDIASIGKISKGECCQIFKKYLHITPIKYLMEYRIERSIPFLLQKGTTVTDVAFNVGFNCINHYINTFKKLTGSTPYQYKKEILALENSENKI